MFKRLKSFLNPPLPELPEPKRVSHLSVVMKNGDVLSWGSTDLPENYKVGPSYSVDGPWDEFYAWYQSVSLEDSVYHFYSSNDESFITFRYGDIARVHERIIFGEDLVL